MQTKAAGFVEIAHTADWQIRAWAPGFAALLEQCVLGMYELLGLELDFNERMLKRNIKIRGDDEESLLVQFLSEIVFFAEHEGIAFHEFTIDVEDGRLNADLAGRKIGKANKEIKAVTYHNLEIKKTEEGLEVDVVFDV